MRATVLAHLHEHGRSRMADIEASFRCPPAKEFETDREVFSRRTLNIMSLVLVMDDMIEEGLILSDPKEYAGRHATFYYLNPWGGKREKTALPKPSPAGATVSA